MLPKNTMRMWALAALLLPATALAQQNIAQSISFSGIPVPANPYKDGKYQPNPPEPAPTAAAKPALAQPQKIAAPRLLSVAKSYLGQPFGESPDSAPRLGAGTAFIRQIFEQFQVRLPASCQQMESHGRRIVLTKTRPGDLIYFSSPDAYSTEATQVGLVVSEPGAPIRFLHAAEGKVRYAKLDTDAYSGRFISIRRLKCLQR